MRSNAGAGPVLVQAALREHNRLVDAQLTSQDWEKAAWLFRQEIRLRNGIEPGSEDLCLLLYQFATLQYTRSTAYLNHCYMSNLLHPFATCCVSLMLFITVLHVLH